MSSCPICIYCCFNSQFRSEDDSVVDNLKSDIKSVNGKFFVAKSPKSLRNYLNKQSSLFSNVLVVFVREIDRQDFSLHLNDYLKNLKKTDTILIIEGDENEQEVKFYYTKGISFVLVIKDFKRFSIFSELSLNSNLYWVKSIYERIKDMRSEIRGQYDDILGDDSIELKGGAESYSDLDRPRPIKPTRIDPDQSFLKGQLHYEIPDVMQKNQQTICIIRIAQDEMESRLVQISEISEYAQITVTQEMSVELIDVSGGALKITPISNTKQAILEGEYTEWKIGVTPLQYGTYSVYLRVSGHFGRRFKDVVLIEKSIIVQGKNPVEIRNKIVFLAADPSNILMLRLEAAIIEEEINTSPFPEEILFVIFFDIAGFDLSKVLLDEKPTLIHFSGHGTAKGIFLIKEQYADFFPLKQRQRGLGQDSYIPDPVLASTEMLKLLFETIQTKLKVECVLFNSCFSEFQAEAVASSVPYVIGTQCKIEDIDAISFSAGFYRGLSRRMTYKDSFQLGRAQINLASGGEKVTEGLLVFINKISGFNDALK